MEKTADSLGEPGTLYRVKILAVNDKGLKSAFSNDCIFALASLPARPNAVFKNNDLSTSDSIYVQWQRVTVGTLPILGYKLYADTGRNDDLRLIYDGSFDP